VAPQRQKPSRGVALPPQHTGSSLFHALLSAAVERFPNVLAAAELPSQQSVWKRSYGEILARFEARRAASAERVEIARFIVERGRDLLEYIDEQGSRPLGEHLSQLTEASPLETLPLGDAPLLRAEVPFEGTRYCGSDVLSLIDRLAESGDLTSAARTALRWSVEFIEAQGGTLDLRGQRFVVLGAGAELAPTALLLNAGANVLWVDINDPSSWLATRSLGAGTLTYSREPLNLLQNPGAVRAAIDRFAAEGGAVHLGHFAYASGASREFRLSATMNAIADHLAPGAVRSIAMLVSPTTVPTLQPESLQAAARQLSVEPVWKAALNRTGLLPKPGHYAANGVRIGLSAVSIQGLSYQAAQYISKLCAAETFAVFGAGASKPTVSANVAGITRTRSLSHPLFAAAFIGAPRFGVRIFEPETTRALSGLLIIHDLFNPAAAGSSSRALDPIDRAALLHSQQVHGGIYNMPYVLEPAIRIAAVIGMGRHPSVLLGRGNGRSAAALA
jgi:hypothetical protein